MKVASEKDATYVMKCAKADSKKYGITAYFINGNNEWYVIGVENINVETHKLQKAKCSYGIKFYVNGKVWHLANPELYYSYKDRGMKDIKNTQDVCYFLRFCVPDLQTTEVRNGSYALKIEKKHLNYRICEYNTQGNRKRNIEFETIPGDFSDVTLEIMNIITDVIIRWKRELLINNHKIWHVKL